MIIIKLMIILLVPVLLILPFLPIRWFFSYSYFASPTVSRKRTLFNILVLALLALACIIFMPLLRNLTLWIASLKPIRWVLSKIPSYAKYSTDLAITIFVNFLYCFISLLVLLLIRGGEAVGDRIKKLRKNAKKRRGSWKDKLKKLGEKGEKKDSGSEEEEPGGESLPEELLPPPEEPLAESRIVLPGTVVEKKSRKSRKRRPAAEKEQAPEPTGPAKLFQAIYGLFYEHVEAKWFVRPQTKHVATHLRYFLVLVGAMYALILILFLIPALFHVTLLENWLYRLLQFFLAVNYFYPVLSLAVLVLICRILDGETSPMDPTEAETDPKLQQKGYIVDLDQVEANLIKVCGKDHEVQSFFSSDVLNSGTDRTRVDLYESDLLASVADYVKSQGLEMNQEYLLGVRSYFEGKNVLFHAPLYTAVGAYLYAAFNLRIMQGERMVVICHNRSQIPNYIEQMNQGFMNLTRTHKPLWKIVTREELGRDAEEDILVLTPEDFRDERLFASAGEFFSQVSIALLPDANQVVSANNYYCQVISQRLQQNCKKELQYVFLSTRTTLNLDNALTEYFLLDSKPVFARGDYSYGDVHIYIWRAKKDGAVVLDNAGQTMPLEVFISDIAYHSGIIEPNLISDSAIFSNQINPHWLDIYDSSKRPLGFAIVADDSFNLPSVIHAYSRYIGKKASVIHIISRQYLLRNYFYAHAPRYLFEQPLMERSMVEHAKPEKTGAVLLLCRLMEGMPVDDFVAEMNKLAGGTETDASDFGQISALVDRCLEYAVGQKPDSRQEHFSLFLPENEFYPRLHIRIYENYDVLSHLMEETDLIQLRFTNGARAPVLINLFKRMLDQRYLQGQNLVFANQNYEIRRIDRQNGIIVVDDAAAVHGLAMDYVQLRNYSLLNTDIAQVCREENPGEEMLDSTVQQMRKDFIGESTVASAIIMLQSDSSFRVQSDTTGYYLIHTDGRSLRVTDDNIPVIRLNDRAREDLRREVSGGVYLRLELKRSRDDRLTMTLAALLQEMMKTLFPDCYFCLSVCPILENPKAIYEHPDFKCRTIAEFYPRLENWGSVRPDSIELLLVDDCEGGTGAMNLLFEPEGTFLQNILWMLSDYLEWQKDNEPYPYIFFGMEEQPAIFDLDGIRPILQSFARNYVREHDVHSQLNAENRCHLCGLDIDEPYLWHGKHMICQDCSEEYAPDEEEAFLILKYAVHYLVSTFQVELPELQIRNEEQLPGDALSSLDLEQNTILLQEELPLRVMHVQIIKQLVRYWQLTNLDINGDPLLDGQPLLVSLQYLRFLQQYQYAQILHREYLLGKDDASSGYCALLQALQSEGHDNSFLYLQKRIKKSGGKPVKRFTKKTSTRSKRDTKVSYYFRSQLSTAETAAYDAILAGYLNHDESIDLSSCSVLTDDIDRIHLSLLQDHPEIFWTNGLLSYEYNKSDKHVTTVTPKYTLTKEERDHAQQEIDEAIAPFISEIGDDLDDYDVALKLYEKLTEFLDYDTIALERQKRKSSEERYNSMDDLRNIYGAIVKHKSVCAGYAKAYQYLLQSFGVEALYVTGTCNEGGRHAWNIIRLEGDYYQTDVTWGDYSNTDPSKDRKGMSYAYFAVTDEQIQRSRSSDTELPLPKCHSDSCNYYVRSGLHFTRYDATEIRNALVEKLKDPDVSFVEFRFDNVKLLHDAKFFLCENGGLYEAARLAERELGITSHIVLEDLRLLKILFD